MSDFDGVKLCELCGEYATAGRLCTSCQAQEQIDQEPGYGFMDDFVDLGTPPETTKEEAALENLTAMVEQFVAGVDRLVELIDELEPEMPIMSVDWDTLRDALLVAKYQFDPDQDDHGRE